MTTARLTTHVFVDFENVSDIDLNLITGRPVHVTLLIGKKQQKLDLTLVKQIHHFASQVDLIEVGASGRNALDMTLSHYLGRAIQQHPKDQFCIVSGDKDYDVLIEHLKRNDHKVARFDRFANLPGLPQAPKSPTPASSKKPATAPSKHPVKLDRRAKVIERFKSATNKNRPTTKSALISHIKTTLGKESTEEKVADIVRELRETKVLEIDVNHKVLYDPKS
ncbi:MAG: NYN domain-containing protein [Cephaloticoccus sp.]|nr:NYN domain-containing protein [Cephaloticoccus sp.]MCF7761499.1 NYN domain-containing protein [Cephaloticoccus sp.]